ncbi:hypothetical protein TEHD86_0186 [Tetragenococcus halophilus subsp. halophilus]|uniref:Uncharacterized protein n=1 Tax=Tetragenococcus halophilus subsp. halophilus TaxID=1513897 RepID=A0A2H6DR51_TETHA|nr:hypothetical protein [Tetragenococcus halophilus]MCT8311240.1 hypothetical protein [Tetragenococcus halophilus]RQD30851.1 hypothetical protein C7K42_07745 [Tetragenococcus halophilus subsp. halophilus DSM 20339]GBD59216.1 hypothetical protein TEHN0098T_1212 [Tetragenococcus halophilus subsp. halophilus]GBD69288.1 hypothetical protein TEHN7118_2094 [Tetragenococcus halophilus subsp. halophilus]GBD79722.1 hypothetical protein TEHD10_0785 [Tetragenococcus halophilus subsp. halophilus]
MAFEDKAESIKESLPKKNISRDREPRISKSYTLKKRVAEELTKKAEEEEITASRYLEKLLRKEFNL